MQYGYPEESRREVRTITVDMPRDLAGTYDPTSKKPPIKVYGPLTGKTDDIDDAPEHTPVDVDVDGTAAKFSFEPPLGPGRYRVVAYQSRFRAADKEPFQLTADNGEPWTGWTMQVLNAQPRHGPRPPEQELKEGQPTEKEQTRRSTQVWLDGKPARPVNLSGEVLTVVGADPDRVELEVQSLIPGSQASMWEKHVHRTEHEVEGSPAVSFASAGPMTEDYVWAKFHGKDTTGRVPLRPEGGIQLGIPVHREPTPARFDPLISGTPEPIVQESEGQSAIVSNALDEAAGAQVAYSFRSLSSSYTGPVVQARRGDGTHHPVETRAFTAKQIADGDLAAWAGPTGQVFLHTLYDQASNGREAQGTFRIRATPNDVPALATNTGIGVTEGGTHALGPQHLEAEDQTSAPVSIVYTLKTAPLHADLLVDGTVISEGATFTQRQINRGLVHVRRDGSEPDTDSFEVTVADQRGAESAYHAVPIDVDPVNDAPVPGPNTYRVPVGDTLTVDAANWLVAGASDAEGDVVEFVEITDYPGHGTLTADENGGFEYEPGRTGPQHFTFTITDGQATTEGDATIIVEGGPVTATNTGASLAQGETHAITPSSLEVTDDESPAEDIEIQVVTAPDVGTLVVDGTEDPASFTQADVNDGLVSYRHDGSGRPRDQFEFTAADADGNPMGVVETFKLAITTPNEDPSAFDNVYETAEDTALEVDAPGLLANAEDPDGWDTPQVTTAPVEGPAHGTLTLREDGSFTYVPDSDFHGQDEFVYEINDGRGGTAEATATVVTRSLNDAPTITKNMGLVLEPGTTKTITDERIVVDDPEDKATGLFYQITVPPEQGQLFHRDSKLGEGDIFSHDDVKNGLISYEHAEDGLQSDAFEFTVTDQGGHCNAVQPNLRLQPEILDAGGDPVINLTGEQFLEIDLKTYPEEYTALISAGITTTGDRVGLFEIGSGGEYEQYGIDENGRAFFGDTDFYDDLTPYSPTGRRGAQVHAVRRRGGQLSAELATTDLTEGEVGVPTTPRKRIILGRHAGDEADAFVSEFALWPRKLSDQKTRSLLIGPQNRYVEYAPLVTPHTNKAPLDDYQTKPAVWPTDIYDPMITPDRNPRFLEDSRYINEEKERGWTPIEERWAVFDLPLQSEITVRVDGVEVWTGQTRFIPTLVTPRQVTSELGWHINTDADKRQAMQKIWQASMKALQLWGCKPPATPPPSMVEFVLTYLANPPSRSDGVQGASTVQLGDQSTTGKSDRASERRLSNLADLLDQCKDNVPINIEDMVPIVSAGLASNASPDYYPNPTSQRIMDRVAPLFDPQRFYTKSSRNEYNRLHL